MADALRYTVARWRGMPLVRALWWRFVRRWESEICECGRPVARHIDTWWSAPDDLWMTVTGDAGRVLCPRCFTRLARVRGIWITYRAEVGA